MRLSRVLLCALAFTAAGSLTISTPAMASRGVGKVVQEILNNRNSDLAELKREAANGDVDAMFALGYMYDEGEGVEADPEQAIHWYQEAAKAGSTNAAYNLALIYTNNEDYIDYDLAAKLYQAVIDENGDIDAKFNLGLMYKNGEGVKQNYATAIKLFKEVLEENDDSDAMFHIGWMLDEGGYGVDKDFAEAAKYYQMSIDTNGDLDSTFNLALLYDTGGYGIKKDYKKAAELYNVVIKGNPEDPDPYHNLALIYLEKKSGMYDKNKARDLMKKACELGSSDSCKAVRSIR